MPTIYIAGPMRGKPEYNFPAFDRARAQWEAKGWDVASPADMDRAEGFSEHSSLPDAPQERRRFLAERLLADAAVILKFADAVAFLPGSRLSDGARAELALAQYIGIPCYPSHETFPAAVFAEMTS